MNPRFIGTALLAGLATASLADDWPQWRGPDRSDISRETGLLRNWPSGGPRLLWTFTDAGTGYSGPAVVGDRLYLMGADADNDCLFAVDGRTQRKAWSVPFEPRFHNDYGDGPRGTPTVDGNRVYGLGGGGVLACVEAATGRKLWSVDLKKDLGGQMMSGWGYSESPLVDGDQVVCTPGGSRGTLAALDKTTGKLRWRSKDYTDTAGYASVVVATVGGVRHYVQMTGESVAGVAAADGRLLWRVARASPTAAIPTPVVHDNRVYVTSGYDAGCALVELTPNGDGTTAKQVYANHTMVNHHGGVVLVGEQVYGHSARGGWICQELTSGRVTWKSNKLGKGSLTCADGCLYCYAEDDGTVALVEASPAGWNEKGRFKIPRETSLPRQSGRIWTHPVVANGRLYLRDQDLLFCYDVREPR
jgi:outer membrane protein assembly factor BamB